jgi:hypothetical protein
MTKTTQITNEDLRNARDWLRTNKPEIRKVRAWHVAEYVKAKHNVELDVSTIRGRFITMGEPLSGKVTPTSGTTANATEQPVTEPQREEPKQDTLKELTFPTKEFVKPEELKGYIPKPEQFDNYVERDVDMRLAIHYLAGKYPLTQGKQGTGKTFSHMHYAYRQQLPFFLFSCFEDFKLPKLFGDKTITNGTVEFRESLFVKAIQSPSVILFDEINAISNSNTFDFHALLQNRELFVKDANNGHGQVYRMHDDCFIGFAQNPKSAKYIGGNIKPSNFLGRCTYLTYPEFSTSELKKALGKRFPNVSKDEIAQFVKFYGACVETIERANIPMDISIRQIINVIDLWQHGIPLREAIEDGLASMTESVSQPKAKESFFALAEGVWTGMIQPKKGA